MRKRIVMQMISFSLLLSCSNNENLSNSLNSPINNQQAIGSSSKDLLTDKTFKSAVIEVVYVEGFEPTTAAINSFVSFFNARAYKPNGISVILKSIPSPGTSPYSIQEIADIESANRTKFNTSNQIAIWAFFADGQSTMDTSTSVILGESYRNTSIVIFEKTVQTLSNSPLEPNRTLLETTVITHEFGHILGLTNLGAPLQSNHEDTAHLNHCNVASCLMYWSSETGKNLGNTSTGGIAPQLDAQCIADLRANGGK